jgi:hypothetical protein
MRNPLLLLALACTLSMTGCLTLSVYPLYTAKDLVTDPQIEGKWIPEEDKDVWEIRKNGDAYVASCPTDKTSEPVEMRLVRLGEQRFLDLTSRDTPSLAVAGHMFGKVWIAGEDLNIQLMASSWLEKKVRENRLPSLELSDRDVLLTAPTADLQKLVLRYAGDPEAFEKPVKLRRVR